MTTDLITRRAALGAMASIPVFWAPTVAAAAGADVGGLDTSARAGGLPSGPAESSPDPVQVLVRNYRAALADYHANAPKDEDAGDAYMAEHVDPHFDALCAWSGPARTLEGATEALRLAAEESERLVSPITQPLLRAALACLEGARS